MPHAPFAPTGSDPGHPMVGLICDAAAAQSGTRPVPTVSPGGGDARCGRRWGVPACVQGPLARGGMGQPDGAVPIAEDLQVRKVRAMAGAGGLAGQGGHAGGPSRAQPAPGAFGDRTAASVRQPPRPPQTPSGNAANAASPPPQGRTEPPGTAASARPAARGAARAGGRPPLPGRERRRPGRCIQPRAEARLGRTGARLGRVGDAAMPRRRRTAEAGTPRKDGPHPPCFGPAAAPRAARCGPDRIAGGAEAALLRARRAPYPQTSQNSRHSPLLIPDSSCVTTSPASRRFSTATPCADSDTPPSR